MRFLLLTLTLTTAFLTATSATAATLNVAFGAGVPADPSNLVFKKGPSRSSGGEHFIVKMSGAKSITGIKLSAFSAGKSGKALVHSATGINGATKVALDGLYQFDKVTSGNPVAYQKLVMLPDTTFVEVTPNQAFTQLDIVVEGFTNDDISLLMQITSSDALPVTDLLVSRSSSSEVAGGMINETGFAKFTPDVLQSLMSRAVSPALTDLDGKTFVCTSYTKLNATELNFKSRTYTVTAAGALLSSSELEGTNMTWTGTPDGVALQIENFNGCGKFITQNVIRMTGAGNLISEVVLNLNDYLGLCTAAGYDPVATAAVESNSTFPSLLNPKYVVDSYEFCHPAN